MSAVPAPLPEVRRDCFGAFSHVVASRQGLFLVNESRYEPLAQGAYFGLSLRAGALYAFERGPSAAGPGRILRLQLSPQRDRVLQVEVVAQGLDGGCHQIDFIGGRLHVLDTHRQQVLVYDPALSSVERLSPLPISGSRESQAAGYVHLNAIVARGRQCWLMLHHNGQAPSEIIQVDAAMAIAQRWVLAGYTGCHDIVPLADGELLFCGSDQGVIASTHGRRVPVIPGLMTRGLSVNARRVVVGSSVFGPRHVRPGLPGVVSFFTRAWAWVAHVAVPGSPTDILCLDGEDESLSC